MHINQSQSLTISYNHNGYSNSSYKILLEFESIKLYFVLSCIFINFNFATNQFKFSTITVKISQKIITLLALDLIIILIEIQVEVLARNWYLNGYPTEWSFPDSNTKEKFRFFQGPRCKERMRSKNLEVIQLRNVRWRELKKII